MLIYNLIKYVLYVGPGGSATVRTVPGSIPGGVTGFFSNTFPSDRTMALGVDSAPSENE